MEVSEVSGLFRGGSRFQKNVILPRIGFTFPVSWDNICASSAKAWSLAAELLKQKAGKWMI